MKKKYVTARLLFKNHRNDCEFNTDQNLHHCDQQPALEIRENLEDKGQVDKCDEVAAESSPLSKCLILIRKVLKTLVSNS